jgi:hypothetical protein
MLLRKLFSSFLILLSFIIYSQNVDPNTVDLYYSTKINTSINLELISVDTDFDDNITYTIVSNPSNGTASLSGSTVTYTPSTGYLGTDTFTYKANDGTSDSAVKTVSVKVFKGYKTNFELLHTFKGEAAEDGYGRSIAMSDNNNVIAIGAFRNDGGGSNSGHVRVFSKISGAWLQLGSDIDGESAGDYSGVSVDLSADGSVLAVGAYLNDGNGANVGHVRIYNWNGSSWVQRGSDIDGGSNGDEQFGWTVALSADGNIFAASAWKADYVGRTNNGIVRVYSWDGSSWSQIGSPLAETTNEDLYGTHLSFSRDGKKIAIGVPGLDNNNGDDSGGVQTREWVTSEGAYSFNGSRVVDGPAGSGLTINSFSNDGKIVAVGGNNYDSEKGIARVYQRDANNQWVQMGSDLTGDSAGDHFALVSLSGDGKILAVGGDLNDTGGTDAGHIKLYNYINNQWSQIGSTISGDSSGDQLGFNPLVSRDGTLVLVPVINDDTTNGDDSGSVRLYNLINSSNSKPVATAQTVTATEQTAKEITLAGTDADGETLTYSIVDSPSNGTVTLNGNTATYTSTSDTATSDSFTFKVNDGTVDSDAATVTINITAVNDKPVATAQTVTATEETAKIITLAGTDAEGDTITYIIASLPTNGTLADNGTAITSDDLPKTTTGTDVVYTSTSDTATSDSFTFKVNDGTVDSDATTVTINITAVNDKPVATAQTVTATEETAKTITLAGTDADGDTLSYIVSSLPSNGTLTDNGTAITSDDLPKTTNGTDVVYTATSESATSDSFTFKVNDGTVDSDAATVTINITAVNDKPVATAQTVTATEQTEKEIILAGTDADGDTITYIVSSLPSNGTLSDNGTVITSDDLPKTTTGTDVNYISTSDSATSDSFSFKVNDGTVDSDATTVTINITAVNDKPVATAQTVTATEETAKTITLAGTDADGDTLSYIVASLPSNGTLSDNGTVITSDDLPKTTSGTDVVYTATSESATSDSFTFKVNDGTVDSDTATVTINITQQLRITISSEKSEIYEHEKTKVTASIPTEHSKDIKIEIDFSGNATYEVDYTTDYISELIIEKGSLSGIIEISAIEELPENNEDDEEIIMTLSTETELVKLASSDPTKVVIKNNTIEFEKKDNPFIELSKSSISWGDYDRDGDMDLAIMGQSNSVGAVTAIYENKDGSFEDTNQNFTNVYDGDISWVDLNKDGWLDLVVSGFNQTAKTSIYINKEGQYFETSTTDWGIPNAYRSVMSWGDLDNDGDIDLAMSGLLDSGDDFFHTGYLRVDGEERFTPTLIGYFSAINGDHAIADFDQDSDNDIIFSGEYGNEIRSQIKLNSFISPNDPKYENLPLKYSRDNEENIPVALTNSSIETYFNQTSKELSYILMGRDSNDELQVVVRSVGGLDRKSNTPAVALENGDIAVGDINNDGFNDFLFTGEDSNGSAVTKLFYTNASKIFESDFNFVGLRESTAEFVDYDSDGDLDIFITGLSDSGAETILYQVNLNSKVNTAPTEVKNLSVTDLGYGNVKFDWDESTDDFSNAVGYSLKIGTSEGGTELSNTLSNLETGSRLISAPPPIQTNQFETNLYPGIYYISAQSIDPGVKASKFSDEIQYTLLYEWKLLNQGGIEDKFIPGKQNPLLRLVDLDGDNDLDLLYGSSVADPSNTGTNSLNKLTGHRYDSDNKRLLRIDREAKTEGSLANYAVEFITDIQVGKINGDEFLDVVINIYNKNGEKELNVYFGKENTNNSGEASKALLYDKVKIGDGLFDGKLKISDLNNDGQLEIVQVGLTSDNTTSGLPKFFTYYYNSDSSDFEQKDVSDQIAQLTNSSFDFGDVDNDQDIDFVISGFDQSSGLKSYLYENISDSGGDFKLEVTDNNFAATRDGSIDFFDYDTDGDLDILITGTSDSGDIFDIYVNKINEDITDWPRLNSIDIPGLRNSKIDYGDFNGDGYSDLLYSGVQSGLGKISELREFNESSNSYIKSTFDIGEIVDADVEFGDIDGDGDLDFVLAGTNKDNDNYHTISTFLNVRSESASFQSSDSVNPVDNDILQSVVLGSQNQNIKYVKNNPPSAPSIKGAKFLTEQSSVQGKLTVELEWNSSTDDLTQSAGLSYSIRVGTSPGGSQIMSPNASENGIRTTPSKGNAEHNLKWKLALSPDTYYWSVQAVDASFIGSQFSEEIELIVTEDDIIVKIDTDEDGVYDYQDQCPDTPEGTTVDVNGCPVFTLPLDNNKVSVTSASCIGNADGSIGLSVEDASFSYSVTVTGQDDPITLGGETKTASVTGLGTGAYTVCFTVEGQDGYEQCFEVNIEEPKALSVFIDVNNDTRKTSIQLSGSSTYTVDINGESYDVKGDRFNTTLPSGLSIITISTDLDCQGIIEREVFISEDIHYYPNPTQTDVNVHVSGEDTMVQVSVFSEKGDLIYTRKQQIQDFSRKTNIDLSTQITGTYIVVMDGPTVRKTFKIVKR